MVNPKPSDLVPFSPAKEISADDTLDEMRQVFRYTFIDVSGQPLRTQIIFDRVHKKNKAFSKPAGFFQMSETGQHIQLAKNSLASATILACFQRGIKNKPDTETIRRAVQSVVDTLVEDIVLLTTVMLGEIELHGRSRFG